MIVHVDVTWEDGDCLIVHADITESWISSCMVVHHGGWVGGGPGRCWN